QVEQQRGRAPQGLFLWRQGAVDAAEHGADCSLVGRPYRPVPERRFNQLVELLVVHFHSSSFIMLPSARRRFCLPRTSKVSTADTDVSRISATSALLMPSP